jgi:GTP pyrophosphokinase
MLNEHVFVFTPKGDVYDLPEGATIIDFAYAIHSQVGNKCVGAKVNKRMVPISTKLKTGDRVEIVTSNTSKGPSPDWLKLAKTNAARVKIKQFFKGENREENIARGRNMLEHEAKRQGRVLSELLSEQYLDYMSNKNKLSTADDILAAVGYGEFSTLQIISKALEFYKPAAGTPQPEEIAPPEKIFVKKKNTGGVLIDGHDGFSVRLAHCCKPVPGDAIIGYLSRGHGVIAHKADCPNIKGFETERLIEAAWDIKSTETYVASFKIVAENRTGILAEVTKLISNRKIPIAAATINTKTPDGTVIMNISVEIRNADDLSELIHKIQNSIDEVIEIRR